MDNMKKTFKWIFIFMCLFGLCWCENNLFAKPKQEHKKTKYQCHVVVHKKKIIHKKKVTKVKKQSKAKKHHHFVPVFRDYHSHKPKHHKQPSCEVKETIAKVIPIKPIILGNKPIHKHKVKKIIHYENLYKE